MPQQAPLRYAFATLGARDSFNFACSLWLESSERHLAINIAGVLRLRAISRPWATGLLGASLRMTDLWGVSLKNLLVRGWGKRASRSLDQNILVGV